MLLALPSTRARKGRPKPIWESCGNRTSRPSSPLLSAAGGKLTAENKFVVKTVLHDENGDTLLREDYRETREKAQELKDLADFGYAGLFGKGQTKVTTEIIER